MANMETDLFCFEIVLGPGTNTVSFQNKNRNKVWLFVSNQWNRTMNGPSSPLESPAGPAGLAGRVSALPTGGSSRGCKNVGGRSRRPGGDHSINSRYGQCRKLHPNKSRIQKPSRTTIQTVSASSTTSWRKPATALRRRASPATPIRQQRRVTS